MTWKFDCSRITLAREARGGMLQAELARLIDVSPQQLSQWEKGTVVPGQVALEKIMNALQTPPQFFFVQSGNDGNLTGNEGDTP